MNYETSYGDGRRRWKPTGDTIHSGYSTLLLHLHGDLLNDGLRESASMVNGNVCTVNRSRYFAIQ